LSDLHARVAEAKARVEAEAAAQEQRLQEANNTIQTMRQEKAALEAEVAGFKAVEAARIPPPQPPAGPAADELVKSKTCVVM